jgi:hypothetical protein
VEFTAGQGPRPPTEREAVHTPFEENTVTTDIPTSSPPITPTTVHARGSDYAVLSREVKETGLLKRRPGYYSVKIWTNLLLLAAGWTAFALLGSSWWQLLVAAFLGVMFTQTAFIGHDAGHQQITASKRVNNLRRAQRLIRTFCAKHGIAYHETGLFDSYGQVLRHLHAVGGPLRPELEY